MTRFLLKLQLAALSTLLFAGILSAQTYVVEGTMTTTTTETEWTSDGSPMNQWVGKKFVILPKPRHLQRYGYSTLRHPDGGFIIPTYGECAGMVGTVMDVYDDGRTDRKVMIKLDNGEIYTAVSSSGIFAEIAPEEDFETARTSWRGRTVWLYHGPVYAYDEDTGRYYTWQSGRYEPVVVRDVVPGWNHNRPVRLIVVTEDGREGFIDVQVSDTNVWEPYYGDNRYDVYFVTEDPHKY